MSTSTTIPTTTTSASLTPIQKAIKIFTTGNYSTQFITNYNGNAFSLLHGIKSITLNGSNYFYVPDYKLQV